MSRKDFQCRSVDGVKGPARSGILDDSEIDRIMKYLKRNKNRCSASEELPYKASQHRLILKKNDRQCNERTSCDKWLINFLTCWTTVFDWIIFVVETFRCGDESLSVSSVWWSFAFKAANVDWLFKFISKRISFHSTATTLIYCDLEDTHARETLIPPHQTPKV